MATQNANLYFRHVQPARVLWGAVKLHATQELGGCTTAQHVVKALSEVPVQVIEHQVNSACLGVCASVLSEALLKGEFVLDYQPKLNLKEGRITAAEALIRWRHPVRGMIPPLRFVPFAEQTGFIRKITPWVLRQVIED